MLRWMLAACLLAATAGSAWADAADDLNAGLDAAKNRHYDDGIRLLTNALDSKQLSPADQAQAYKARGLMYQRQNKQKEAAADYSAAITLAPKDAAAYDMRGTTYAGMGSFDQAIADYDAALKLDAQDASAYNNRGFAYTAKGQLDKAVADLNTAIKLSPNDVSAHRNRGNAYRLLGQNDMALADYSAVLQINPRDVVTLYDRGHVQFMSGNFSGAASDFSQSLALMPKQPYTAIWLYLSRARMGQPDRKELAANAAKTDAAAWPAPVIAFYLGKSSANQVETAATDSDPQLQRGKQCQAPFYIGEYELLSDNRNAAKPLLQQAIDSCPQGLYEHDTAKIELQRLSS